jgi:hypothetical protein
LIVRFACAENANENVKKVLATTEEQHKREHN